VKRVVREGAHLQWKKGLQEGGRSLFLESKGQKCTEGVKSSDFHNGRREQAVGENKTKVRIALSPEGGKSFRKTNLTSKKGGGRLKKPKKGRRAMCAGINGNGEEEGPDRPLRGKQDWVRGVKLR